MGKWYLKLKTIMNKTSEEILKQLEERLQTVNFDIKTKNIGIVEKYNDGVITATGLSQAALGEEVEFDKGSRGLVLNLNEDTVSIVLLDQGANIVQGDTIKTTGRLLSIMVSDDILGRVVSPTGEPLDGKTGIKKGVSMPLERIAAGVIDRQPVDTPMKTGIKAIDAMIPVGRGQRQLIIGDRGLGKTAIAIDTIINQKDPATGKKQVICVYVAIGQKQSTVAQIIEKLRL